MADHRCTAPASKFIPNLVETVKGLCKARVGTLEAVIAARGAVASARTPQEKMEASEPFPRADLAFFFAVAESYPELKANERISSSFSPSSLILKIALATH